jgi:solute carrier family 66, member 2
MTLIGNIYYGLVGWFRTSLGYLAPMFLILSPIISYSDQALSMRRNRSSAGFSLDIPLIMLVASLLR